ncbi:hypothetical protein CHLNCDRAFT_135913 [Chlorella variabilis]|uniref:Follistatin-like domain-containing protein n=1 Tax=Chlorella variabilis TaxID=554065 RepID=E1ZJC6_CHLVA|nr:hypothetical protein CHLNCDRAFT_135913 [Chlorella variabilis]EFN53837.1 hypothetical protein CHLNCDRAFT_135913 [Chlorella variabilis]|eukprot:XP_005845939.1 hypothetical protein CHLNCDRAFT_135913 [Chlorella variabilis]
MALVLAFLAFGGIVRAQLDNPGAAVVAHGDDSSTWQGAHRSILDDDDDDDDDDPPKLTCARKRCPAGSFCVTVKGKPTCIKASCVVPTPVSPCAVKKCGKGKKCKVVGKLGRCVSNCDGVKCATGRVCRLTLKGNPVCLPVRPKPSDDDDDDK